MSNSFLEYFLNRPGIRAYVNTAANKGAVAEALARIPFLPLFIADPRNNISWAFPSVAKGFNMAFTVPELWNRAAAAGCHFPPATNGDIPSPEAERCRFLPTQHRVTVRFLTDRIWHVAVDATIVLTLTGVEVDLSADMPEWSGLDDALDRDVARLIADCWGWVGEPRGQSSADDTARCKYIIGAYNPGDIGGFVPALYNLSIEYMQNACRAGRNHLIVSILALLSQDTRIKDEYQNCTIIPPYPTVG